MPVPKQLAPYAFKPGNKLSAGRPNGSASRVVELRQALFDAVTPDEMQAAVLRMLSIIKTGSNKDAIAAFSLICDRLMGKAKESVEVSAVPAGPTLANYSDAQIEAMVSILSKPERPDDAPEIVVSVPNSVPAADVNPVQQST